jgi:methylated-DNA-[protein]-cysteine S-methyltransferase
MDYDAIWRGPFAALGIVTDGEQLTRIDFLDSATPLLLPRRDTVAELACVELNHYLDKPSYVFQVPVHLSGTLHQIRVWQALPTIAAGQPITYGELARTVGSSARAVGTACGRNRVPVIIPCHRVIAANGQVGGFMRGRRDQDLAIKTWLLTHESSRGR